MIDEREADDVRAWIATAEAPELRLDLRHTVQQGRTRRRHRRIAGGGAVALAVLLAVPGAAMFMRGTTDAPPVAAERTPPPDAPFSCSYQVLPIPAGLDALGSAWQSLNPDVMDPSGRYVATQAIAGMQDSIDGVRVPVLWDNGVGRVISPELRGRPTAVFENGVVVGERMPGGGTWIYRDGKVTNLPMPAGAIALGIATIKANGDILGTVYTAAPNTARVAIWKGGDLANPRYLDAPGDIVTPLASLDDGGVVGWRSVERLPYVWDADGHGTPYVAPAGALDYQAVGVSDGYLYGFGKRAIGEGMVPIRWKIGGDGTAEWLQAPPGLPALADVELTAVGRNGGLLFQVVDKTGPSRLRSFLVRGAHRAELPAPDGHQTYATAMNDIGTKVAGVVNSGTSNTPVIWTC
jgi:hypothetical protein